MRDVNAAHASHDFGDFDDLLGGSEIAGHVEDSAASVRVDVDETGSGHKPAGIDADRGGGVTQQTDGRYGIAADADIGVIPGRAGAIDHLGPCNQQVKAVSLGEQESARY